MSKHTVVQRFLAAQEGTDRSDNPTVVEYAAQTMLKGKDPAASAKDTVKKLSGSENMFFGPGVTLIDAKKLEGALWDRLVNLVLKNIPKMKEGMGHFALDGVMHQFSQKKPAVRAELKKRVVKQLGQDPFPNDDVHKSARYMGKTDELLEIEKQLLGNLTRNIPVTKGQYPDKIVDGLISKGWVIWKPSKVAPTLMLTQKGKGNLIRLNLW